MLCIFSLSIIGCDKEKDEPYTPINTDKGNESPDSQDEDNEDLNSLEDVKKQILGVWVLEMTPNISSEADYYSVIQKVLFNTGGSRYNSIVFL